MKTLVAKKFLIALPTFPHDKGFNHRTILITAEDKQEAVSIAIKLRPNCNIGDVKEVKYQTC
jgi:hypothetical protein